VYGSTPSMMCEIHTCITGIRFILIYRFYYHMFEFTSESVLPGHPDKLADQISDALVDSYLRKDPYSHLAIDVVVTHGEVFVFGEISTEGSVDVERIVRRVIRRVGYTSEEIGLDYRTCEVRTNLIEQSPDIRKGVGIRKIRAGDQGIIFGYAGRWTRELMPLPIMIAHGIARYITGLRSKLSYLRPDGKVQVTVGFGSDGRPVGVNCVVLAVQHDDTVSVKEVREELRCRVSDYLDENWSFLSLDRTKWVINGTGRFVIGGPRADSGLTGKKTAVDTYGGWVGHGGGCLSGKDGTKVDRSATYMTRYVAKNIVASGLAEEVVVQVAYAIGRSRPVSVDVNTNGTGIVPDEQILRLIKREYSFSPGDIIELLDLRKPFYSKLSVFGQVGRNGYPWERVGDL